MWHNPYEGITFDTALQTKSFSHMHTRELTSFQRAYSNGYRHFPNIHYQPAHPTYPLSDWFSPENIPSDIIAAPASEKVMSSNGMGHAIALGSFYASPGHNWDEAVDGPKLTWQEKFTNILNGLQFPTGGGVISAHPGYNQDSLIKSFIDFDERFLGFEIYNDGERWSTGSYVGYYLERLKMWDRILSTGRRCFGFCVSDWQNAPVSESQPDGIYVYGSNILLSTDFTEQALLEAYRNGAFYGILKDTGLRFTNLTATDSTVAVEINRSATIKFYTESGLVKTVVGTSATYDVMNNTFVRVDVQEGDDQHSRLFSNPIMYKDKLELAAEKRAIDRKKRRKMMSILA